MPPRSPIRRYWDSSCFLCILNNEDAADACEQILADAAEGKTKIYVSPIVQLEVIRPKGSPRAARERADRASEWFRNKYIQWRAVDRQVSNRARDFCLDLNLHPRDAVHLAVAVHQKCDLLETLDKDLLKWDGKVPNSPIRIRQPGETKPDTALESHE